MHFNKRGSLINCGLRDWFFSKINSFHWSLKTESLLFLILCLHSFKRILLCVLIWIRALGILILFYVSIRIWDDCCGFFVELIELHSLQLSFLWADLLYESSHWILKYINSGDLALVLRKLNQEVVLKHIVLLIVILNDLTQLVDDSGHSFREICNLQMLVDFL